MSKQRDRPDQFNVLVRGIPLCTDHNAYGCSVDHFFSKYHPYTYQSYHIVHDRKKELPSAFVSFKSRVGAAVAAQMPQHVHPLLWITEFAPEPRDVLWNNLDIPYRRAAVHKIVVFLAATLLTIFFAIPVTAVQGIVQFDKIKQWFPPARAVQLIPSLDSILRGYFPSLILNGFIYLIPYAMFGMAWLEGCASRSQLELTACTMVFYFLVGNVFFLSLFTGSLLDQIGESFSHPKEVPTRLARAVSAQADFFISYILTNGLSGFSLEILQFGLSLWHFIRSCVFCQHSKEDTFLFGFQYYRYIPIVLLAVLIGMVYAVVAPLLLPFLIFYFLLGYAVFINQIEDVYEMLYETYGLYWPKIHHFIFIILVIMQIVMVGLFALKSKAAAAIMTLVLLVLTILYNEYCKLRFLPSFSHCSIQIATDNDEVDEKEGTIEDNRENATNAYSAPWTQDNDYRSRENSSFKLPLISRWSR